MISTAIRDHLPNITAARVGPQVTTPCGLYDGDARLTLHIDGKLLVADNVGGSIHDGVLRCSVYMLAPTPFHSSPFTNLQRLLVMLPEVIK